MENKEHMSLARFIDGGYLAEVNRRVLHPLGLALAIDPEWEGDEPVRILYAGDDEGWVFDASDPELIAKVKNVARVEAAVFPDRLAALGFIIQPVG